MCIIVYKPAGQSCPSWKILKTCFDNNPDGCGFMYAEDGKVHIHKGFMSWRSFKTALKPYKNRVDIPLVAHFRIATSGGVNPQCTHPFPLSHSVGELKALDSECEVGIAHNGIISLTSNATKMSDTMMFIKKFGECIINSPKWYENENSGELLAEVIGSKMLVLSNDGHAEVVGDRWTKDDGIYYSNTSYMPWTWTSNKGCTSYYDNYLDTPSYYNGVATPTYCKNWDCNFPQVQCEHCESNTWCWSEEEMLQAGYLV